MTSLRIADNSTVALTTPPPKKPSREAEYDSSTAYVPAFGGDSFMELPTLRNVGRAFDIELW